MGIEVRAMSPEDYREVLGLWQESPGVGLNESDTEQAVAAFLERNPGMSAVAVAAGAIVGAVLCGHDGRRGTLHHLAVGAGHRRRGAARGLLAHCLRQLGLAGIPKCNIFLFSDNEDGAAFWIRNGWSPRPDLRVLQRRVRAGSEASAA
jgi:ribosomal protein S18 acetylase RimI-like enzyme